MIFELEFSPESKLQLANLKHDPGLEKRYKAVSKALKYLETNPKHPSLNVHPFESFLGPRGEKIWEAYAENNTPGAYRIFFSYGPGKRMISILTVIPHPD
ncbi:MAG: hypothetical protein HQL26_09615 [Candidatus Omnitrophica bacterium]|nr:hypothetical protein [Candidatus Omnitrophota bacterium]